MGPLKAGKQLRREQKKDLKALFGVEATNQRWELRNAEGQRRQMVLGLGRSTLCRGPCAPGPQPDPFLPEMAVRRRWHGRTNPRNIWAAGGDRLPPTPTLVGGWSSPHPPTREGFPHTPT